MITLSDVRVFLEIAQAGGLTAAGRRLKLPKSSVTRQLMRLETELGCRLIDRTTRTLCLTEGGRTFLPYARRLLEDSEEAASILQAGGGEAKGAISISAPYAFARSFLAPHLGRFRMLHPSVRVILSLTSRRVDLASEEIDVAFRIGPLRNTEGSVQHIGEIRFGLFATADYLARAAPVYTPRDLDAHDFLELSSPSVENRIDLHRGSEKVSVGYVPSVCANDPECLRLACIDGAGIAALPHYLVRDDLEHSRLVRVLPEWSPLPAPINLVYLARSAQKARVRVFLDFISETAASSPLVG